MVIERINDVIDNVFLSKYHDINEEELRALRFSIVVIVQSIIVGLIFGPIQYSAGGFGLFIYCPILVLGGLFSLYLINFRRANFFSRLFFIFLCNFLVLFNAKSVGLDAGIQYFFAPLISLPFLMFSSEKKGKYTFLTIYLPIILCSVLYLASNWSPVAQVSLSEEILKVYGLTSTMLALLMVSYSLYHFQSTIDQRNREIVDKNKQIFSSEKLASLGVLTSGIAHEINNPLAVIFGVASQIKRNEISGELAVEEKVHKIDKILKMTERITKIVKSLKRYNQNEENVPIERINVLDLLDEALSFFTQDLQAKEIELKIQSSQFQFALGRESDLLQVFINLFSNSIDVLKSSAKDRWINIQIIENEQDVLISFYDSGEGIPEYVQEKMFDPFFTSKKIGEGTGLGLYICKNLMDGMHGHIEYIPGAHTGFRLRLKREATPESISE